MRHPFETALEGVTRAEAQASPAPLPRSETVCDLQPAAGVHSLWELAAAWTPEADPPPPAPAAPPPSAPPEDIAAEIGLAELAAPADIARARRRFMWENHPDRRADLDRDLANRRVAIANMLLDRLQATLIKRRGK